MDPQPMGKVRDLSRLAGRGAARSTVRWSSLWKFLGICLLAAVVGDSAVGLPHARGAAAVDGMPRPVQAQGPALLPQRITFGQPKDTAVGQPVRLLASTDEDANENLAVSFRSDTPDLCTVSGATATPTAPGFCVITAIQGGDGSYAPAPDVARAFLAHSGPKSQPITFDPPQVAAVDVASATSGFPGALTILLGAVVFAAAGATSLVRRVRRSHRPPEPQPTVRADPDPGPPTLVSVQNTGAGATHTVRIESSPGASLTRIKEGKS